MKVVYETRPGNVYTIGMHGAERICDQMARLIIAKKDFTIGEAVTAISVNGTWFVRAVNQQELESRWLTTQQ